MDNEKQSFKDEIVEAITSDKKLVRRIVDRAVWLFIFAGGTLTLTICAIFYSQAESILSLISQFVLHFFKT